MKFRVFQESDLGALHQAFTEAFSTYSIPFRLTFDVFRKRILNKLALDPKTSLLAFDEDKCVGFIMHAKAEYRHVPTLYNGGTGVIPSARGNHLSEKAYQYLGTAIQQSGARKVILEVITTNEPAINIYNRLGFQYTKTYKCYKKTGRGTKHRSIEKEINISQQHHWNTLAYADCADFEPSFIDAFPHLLHNQSNETCLEAYYEDQLAGFIIFQPHLGRISQLGVKKSYRQKGIGTHLIHLSESLSGGKELTVINVPEQAVEMDQFLQGVGFENQLDQYEMELVI